MMLRQICWLAEGRINKWRCSKVGALMGVGWRRARCNVWYDLEFTKRQGPLYLLFSIFCLQTLRSTKPLSNVVKCRSVLAKFGQRVVLETVLCCYAMTTLMVPCQWLTSDAVRAEITTATRTINQERLNHIAVLTCHRNKADSIDLKGMLNTFIARNDIGAAAFATFPKQ